MTMTELEEEISHSDLCKRFAEHELKKNTSKVVLYEYKSTASMREEPDVLVFQFDKTILYEVKVSHSDFIADAKKECRKKYKIPMWFECLERGDGIKQRALIRIHNYCPELFLKEYPHLGNERYFVCPKGVIRPEELPFGWGLVEYNDKTDRFTIKVWSKNFRTDMHLERNLLLHSMQRKYNNNNTGILVRRY